MAASTNYDLQDRLNKFALSILEVTNQGNGTFAQVHLNKQLIRSGTSCALNYSEALASESKRDFIHKISIVVKELRESRTCLFLLRNSKFMKSSEATIQAHKEVEELIAIFMTSLKTARKNAISKK